jgi:hypothetical protein
VLSDWAKAYYGPLHSVLEPIFESKTTNVMLTNIFTSRISEITKKMKSSQSQFKA